MIKAQVFSFLLSEDGAIAVDWLALIAATIGVGLLGVHIISQSAAIVSSDIVAALRDAGVTGSVTEHGYHISSSSQRP